MVVFRPLHLILIILVLALETKLVFLPNLACYIDFSSPSGQVTPSFVFPPSCSTDQRAVVKQLFPPDATMKLTSCPVNSWWDDYLLKDFFVTEYPKRKKQRRIVSIFVGCNKGDDAVLALQKLSGNPNVNNTEWSAMLRVAGSNPRFLRRVCPADDLKHPLIQAHPLKDTPSTNAFVYCVEAMPLTAQLLKATRKQFQSWKHQFVVSHLAMGPQDGTILFPAPEGQPGREDTGLSYCSGDAAQQQQHHCVRVPLYTLDTYVRKFVLLEEEDLVIDYLSVDAEGHDWDVLGSGGADWVLRHTRYLEFEYHSVGTWPQYTLSNATRYLQYKYGFVCYYAGRSFLWRLTDDCFQEYMDAHRWSNVACVNVRLQPRLAQQMERQFQSQLAPHLTKNVTAAEGNDASR